MAKKVLYPEMLAEITKLNTDGLTIGSIAARYGVCSTTLSSFCKRNNVALINHSPRYAGIEGVLHQKERHLRRHIQNPALRKARYAVYVAIKQGKLPKARDRVCLYCDNMAYVWHHHKGYAKENWLDVIPVCSKHHGLIHKGVHNRCQD
ncbi:MAG: hypothetical protein WC196_02710 [Bacilli bacterium]